MTATTSHTITQSWVLIEEATSVFLQLQSPGPVLVHVGSTLPTGSVPSVTMIFDADNNSTLANLSLEGIEALGRVYARSRDNETNYLTAICSGIVA